MKGKGLLESGGWRWNAGRFGLTSITRCLASPRVVLGQRPTTIFIG